MKLLTAALIAASCLLSTAATAKELDSRKVDQLRKALLCNTQPSFSKLSELVYSMGGHNPENRTGSYRGTYTIPYSFTMLNQPVTEFNVTRFLTENDNYIYRITTPVPNVSPSEAADLLGIPLDMETKQYASGRLGIHVLNGQTVFICTRY